MHRLSPGCTEWRAPSTPSLEIQMLVVLNDACRERGAAAWRTVMTWPTAESSSKE